ncbi:uncharacterized protein LOC117927761 isoform X1 [Vitis riparia]|uniref:uncharacterized protein LOC117927761 isoform X1 n=1 Tax=Vitis riparia TaxID=96939 RepID=UPI00155AF185|nr:uncharacterized protein LOC117927761 isoform X1 [Vitis riparia]
MATSSRFLFTNGVISRTSDTPLVSTLLEAHPGAYTTSRTHNNTSCLLFWERHLQRLAESTRILYNSKPGFLFKSNKPMPSLLPLSVWDSVIQSLVDDSMNKAIPIVLNERRSGGELAITTLVSGNFEKLSGNENVDEERISQILDVYLHVGSYVPPVFGVRENCAKLAVVGPGRDVAMAKYSDWLRLRKPLEKLRPDLVTELLLSNDGDQILEGCITNFFVVCRKDSSEVKAKNLHDYGSTSSFEVQTAPLSDGVLPGIIRQIVIEVCLSMGIPLREVAPSWSKCELWEEAFITNSLRVMQHVETIQAPSSWEQLESNNWKEVSWEEKRFKEGPGMITAVIQKEIMEKASLEGFPMSNFI